MSQTSITFNTLTLDQKQSMQDVYQLMDKLKTFKNKANQKLMIYLFGEKRALHHVVQFQLIADITQWITQLTSDEKGIVLANIYYNENLYAHC